MKITTPQAEGSEHRFPQYLECLSPVLGHCDRAEPFQAYCTGLLLRLERKSVEPMAARLEPGNVASKHQSLRHLVAEAPGSDQAVLAAARDYALPSLESHGPGRAWIVEDTGIPKKGKHSVGVARQYCGQLGKTDNCQVAVRSSLAKESASLPVAYQLYLPESWTEDVPRRCQAGVPPELEFGTKAEVALGQIRTAQEQGLPPGVVLADAGYGKDTAFREGVRALGLD